ncbi:hypothetical protein WGA77_29070 [Nocardia seriolae]|uniref:Uncharacterized protein n=1 Tax=Nocardia seriolae TaxID=37332 RepID=A0ABC9YQ07_9NOCA|nr:hypothetical protein [Nocardia seriolae]WKY54252.1 hypothetical protein Q5P07_09475 [Nocardia seriolae]WNJ61036.1 hypothetical protein RMO66_10200 [Nocardia seriolae]BEK86220.1 hypothetical protein NSERKGN1266_21710 [Nocardia seriolae]BEK97847.1 hypothetical protein NSER024013_57530 [Nocardia seriolae]GAM45469.1 hypothetical protein NS07_v2contig00015-0084 [Nocardia seriolae]
MIGRDQAHFLDRGRPRQDRFEDLPGFLTHAQRLFGGDPAVGVGVPDAQGLLEVFGGVVFPSGFLGQGTAIHLRHHAVFDSGHPTLGGFPFPHQGHGIVIDEGGQRIVEQGVGRTRHHGDRVCGRDVVENHSLPGHVIVFTLITLMLEPELSDIAT